MKIDEIGNPKHNSPGAAPRDSATASQAPHANRRPRASESEDRVHLSSQARELVKARRQLDALPDIDTEKVREIQHRLQSGRYRLDADKIAERMIRDVLDDND